MRIIQARALAVAVPLAVTVLAGPALAGCGGGSGSGGSPSAAAASHGAASHGAASHSAASHAAGGQATAGSASGSTGGSGSSTGGTVSAAAGVHPGGGSPADAVDAYYTALMAGNGALACQYINWPDTGTCPAHKLPRVTGHITIGKVAIDSANAIAIVVVLGQLCDAQGSHCTSNANPSLGLPTGSESVSMAYSKDTVAGTGNSMSPALVSESSHGGWWIDVNGP
jgi:hypothetical protein